MTAIGSLLIAGLIITAGQIVWQIATDSDPLKELRKHGHTQRR